MHTEIQGVCYLACPLTGPGIAGLAPHWTLHQEIWPCPPMGKFAHIHRGEMAPQLTTDMGKLFPMAWTYKS